jgi:hypothetical protein
VFDHFTGPILRVTFNSIASRQDVVYGLTGNSEFPSKSRLVFACSRSLSDCLHLGCGSVEVGPAMNARRADGKSKSQGPGIYAMWIEFGLKRKQFPAQAFMRPTFDATAEKAVKLFSDTLKEALEEIAKE